MGCGSSKNNEVADPSTLVNDKGHPVTCDCAECCLRLPDQTETETQHPIQEVTSEWNSDNEEEDGDSEPAVVEEGTPNLIIRRSRLNQKVQAGIHGKVREKMAAKATILKQKSILNTLKSVFDRYATGQMGGGFDSDRTIDIRHIRTGLDAIYIAPETVNRPSMGGTDVNAMMKEREDAVNKGYDDAIARIEPSEREGPLDWPAFMIICGTTWKWSRRHFIAAQAAFEEYDKNHDKGLSREELIPFLESIRQDADIPYNVDKCLADADLNGDAMLQVDEFCYAFYSWFSRVSREKLRRRSTRAPLTNPLLNRSLQE